MDGTQPNFTNYGQLAVLFSWYILKGSQDCFHTLSMDSYHKWDTKNGFAVMLQFFSLISDVLGGVSRKETRYSAVLYYKIWWLFTVSRYFVCFR